ncbi:hypothetical protein GQ55_5G480300 [Panicum hallii var. hallii]|uniref:Uncharacterized protein n=1 Tax=Panicum hallii var. hallii TaxID=1504633 RepID=A0A2T7DR79_9POAL|nr:hypothetical protein GQ55_5G480300 [Panicum hallii var. hallii]
MQCNPVLIHWRRKLDFARSVNARPRILDPQPPIPFAAIISDCRRLRVSSLPALAPSPPQLPVSLPSISSLPRSPISPATRSRGHRRLQRKVAGACPRT